MNKINTRRGNTQAKQNIVVYKNCHFRMPLSEIYNACRYHHQKKALLNEYVEDPRLQASGMTVLYNNGLTNHGFTLIELLVVVLIIGILAAVALPQYQKAVEKSRMTEMALFIKNSQQAVDVWLLQNGGFPASTTILLNSTNNLLDIDVAGSLNAEKTHSKTGYFVYDSSSPIQCSSDYCSFIIYATNVGGWSGPDVRVLRNINGWSVTCSTSPTDDEGQAWCARFKTVYPDLEIV